MSISSNRSTTANNAIETTYEIQPLWVQVKINLHLNRQQRKNYS